MATRTRLADDIAYYATFQTTYHDDSVENYLSPCPSLSCSSDSTSTPGAASSSASSSLSASPAAFPSPSLLPSPSLHTPPCLPPYSLPYFSPTPRTIQQQRKSKQVRRPYLSPLRREDDGEAYPITNDITVDDDRLGRVTSLTRKLAMEGIMIPVKSIWDEMGKAKCNKWREDLNEEEKRMEREWRRKRMTPEDWEEERKIEKVKRKIRVLEQREKIRRLKEEIQKAGREIKRLRRE
ncbi:hypothetical protein FPQ18DRAFT_303521 [Pyronema domesticum]|uniref:Uncharacterized protein n=1 Tax=Pyronema omphalodes (strain CBS 100304) TaxID=1076935 RepID=U4KVM6_PYROM|nr:hypothetical protein FPQ18DRAFT_303521 [Pyronema domesticum]CCX05658.1 Protein of unknown function [Pyronema omphalodes CBS 100304]